MKYEIVTHDGKTYEIQQDNPQVIGMLAKDLELIPVTLHDGKIEYFAKGNVARIQAKYAPSDATRIEAKADIDSRGTVSPERIRELKEKAFNKTRNSLAPDHMKDAYDKRTMVIEYKGNKRIG